jgi:hypothetical protein
MTFFAASMAMLIRSPLIDPLESTTTTTSLGPDAAPAYHGRKRGSYSPRHHCSPGHCMYAPMSCDP